MDIVFVRVAVEYQDCRKAILFPQPADQNKMLIMSLKLHKLSEDKLDDYELIIQSLDCRAESSDILLTNEVLILQKIKSQKKKLILI